MTPCKSCEELKVILEEMKFCHQQELLVISKDTERLNWIDKNASFVCNEPYKIGPYKVGQLRQMADDGIAHDKHKPTTLLENLGQG